MVRYLKLVCYVFSSTNPTKITRETRTMTKIVDKMMKKREFSREWYYCQETAVLPLCPQAPELMKEKGHTLLGAVLPAAVLVLPPQASAVLLALLPAQVLDHS